MAYCTTHSAIETQAGCTACARPFCDNCLVTFLGQPHCAQCRDRRLAEMQANAAPQAQTGLLFFTVSPVKLVLMTLVTFGLYEVFWFYKHWRIYRDRTGEQVTPLARALLGCGAAADRLALGLRPVSRLAARGRCQLRP